MSVTFEQIKGWGEFILVVLALGAVLKGLFYDRFKLNDLTEKVKLLLEAEASHSRQLYELFLQREQDLKTVTGLSTAVGKIQGSIRAIELLLAKELGRGLLTEEHREHRERETLTLDPP